MTNLDNRRPIKARDANWSKRAAAALAKAHVRPNVISAASVAFAVLGGALLAISGQTPNLVRSATLVLAAACIQGRLLCNLLDGMVAVEHGEGSPAGPLWNEIPDRFADVFFLAGAGYGAAGLGWNFAAALGWICAALALLTAYVRELGHRLGFPADFGGPMAKQQRMAALTITCLIAALEPLFGERGLVIAAGLAVIAIGTAWTVTARVGRLARALAARP